MTTTPPDKHADLDRLILRARMLLGSGLTPQETIDHLTSAGSDTAPIAPGNVFLVVQAARILDQV